MNVEGSRIPDIVVHRTYHEDGTTGILTTKDNKFRCATLERPDLGNATDISCFPEGTYEYFFRDDGRNGRCLELKNTVGRKYIQIHIANSVSNVVGCIAVGVHPVFEIGKPLWVSDSGKTMAALLDVVPMTGTVKVTS